MIHYHSCLADPFHIIAMYLELPPSMCESVIVRCWHRSLAWKENYQVIEGRDETGNEGSRAAKLANEIQVNIKRFEVTENYISNCFLQIL